MSNKQDRVVDRLETWSDLHCQGVPVSAHELCSSCPELAQDVERAMRLLSRLDGFAAIETEALETVTPETPPPIPPANEALLRRLPQLPNLVPNIPNHEVLELLGEGGMGAVYRARDTRLGRIVALKVIKEGLAGAAAQARFQVEAEAVAQLNHPNIVQVYEVGAWQSSGGPLPWLTLEFVASGNLDNLLGQQVMEPLEAARLLRLLARAVQAAHAKGIIHRDLKPGNVLLAPSADEPGLNCALGCPKLTDFGLARRLDAGGNLTQPGSVMGTPHYMAPEQASGMPDIGPPADAYALGAILYRLLTAQPPFRGPTVAETIYKVIHEAPAPLRRLRPDVPPELEALCLRCLDKDPTRRPGVPELIGALDRFLASKPATTHVLSPVPLQTGSTWTRRRILATGFAAVLVGAGLLAWAFRPGDGKKQPLQQTPSGSGGEEGAPLQVRPIRAMHHARLPGGKTSEGKGAIGEKSFSTRFADAVALFVELSAPGYFYVIAFNANGVEQLLWPADEGNNPLPDQAPPKLARLRFPQGGKRYTLSDAPKGGLQAFVVAASRSPLPSFHSWKKERGGVSWRRHAPGTAVWQADHKGVYEVVPGQGADRGNIEAPLGAPPLDVLCGELRVGGVEVVEAIGFGVLPREAE